MKKKSKKILFFVLVILFGSTTIARANTTDINLTIRSGNTIIFSDAIPLPPEGNTELNSHSLNADSVLSIVNNADISSPSFSISDLQYYNSFGSFYLKCITSTAGNDCDNWQYTVNNTYPGVGMDQKILSGGDIIYLYFGPQNKIILSSNNINTNDTLTVASQKYDYNNNQWITRTGVTVGLTQTNPNDPWSPIEIMTNAVNENGQAIFSTIPAGSYNVGIKEDSYFPTETLTVTVPPSSPAGGGIIFSPPIQEKAKFNLQKAFEFLTSQQKEDGSFGENLYTDWTAFALATSENYTDQKIKLGKYLSGIETTNYQLTDYERHAMALMSLGLNPYNIDGENYIEKITDSFDGKQFGDIKKDNDDIFALIVLQNAGYTKDDEIVKNDITFILEAQNKNGSWDESVDMTGAAIQAMTAFSPTPGVRESLIKAKDFLKQNQKNDGGFGNVSSTAWAIEGILALSEKPEDWIKNDNTPLNYLTENQDTDGGIKDEYLQNRIWQTAYVATVLSGKTWNQIMQKFEKPKEIVILLEEKKKEEISKPIVVKNITKKKTQTVKKSNPENLSTQNTATIINSIETKPEPVKKSWFRNLLDKIFSIF